MNDAFSDAFATTLYNETALKPPIYLPVDTVIDQPVDLTIARSHELRHAWESMKR